MESDRGREAAPTSRGDRVGAQYGRGLSGGCTLDKLNAERIGQCPAREVDVDVRIAIGIRDPGCLRPAADYGADDVARPGQVVAVALEARKEEHVHL